MGAVPTAFELLRGWAPRRMPRSRLQRLLPSAGTLPTLGDGLPGASVPLAGLRSFGQVIFINNPLSGALVLLALALQSPLMAALALLGWGSAELAARWMGASAALRRDGLHGFNGVLVGCAVAALADVSGGGAMLVWSLLVLGGAGLSVALLLGPGRRLQQRCGLPPLTLPFCLCTWLLLALAPGLCLATLPPPAFDPSPASGWAALLAGLPRGFGQVFLCSGTLSGSLVLLAVALASPLAALVGLLGALAAGIGGLLAGASGAALAQGLWSYNGILVAIALGGTFYAPTLASLAVALAAALLSSPVAAILAARLPAGLPVLTVPFILTTWAGLLLLRQALPALIPVALHSTLTPEEHRRRFLTARQVLGDFRRRLSAGAAAAGPAGRSSRAPSERPAALGDLFDRLDHSGDGRIDLVELRRALAASAAGEADTPLRSVLQAMDQDGDGQLDRGEFEALLLRLKALHEQEERLLLYLLPADTNGDDRLGPPELERLLRSIGAAPLTALEQQRLFGAEQGLSWRDFVDRLLLA
jgi:urea transporter